MKKGFKLSILFFAGILAITGCKKDEVFKQQTQLTKKQQPITVVEAKKVFLSNFDIDMPFSSEAFIFNPSIKRKNLDWNKAVSFNNDQRFSIIEIPIEFNKGISSLIKKDGLVLSTAKFASQSKLLFLKNRKSGYVYTTIMTVLPEKTEINQNEFHYQSLPLNFTGVVTFSNWDGKLNNSWLYKNGTVTKKITSKGVKINDILPSYANPNGNGQNCEDYIIDTWERDCYYDFNEDYYCTSWALINSQPVTICGSGSGSGGGEYIEHEVDEEDILESFDDRISEDELAGCLSSVFSGVKAIGEGKFATIIQNFSSELPNYNWKVKSAFLPNTSDNAITGHTPISGYFVTTFNMTMLRGASDLSIARTMIHEAIHAYLSYYFNYDLTTYTKTYLELIRMYRVDKNGTSLNEEQHSIMEAEFVNNVIAPALTQFGVSKGYNLDPNYYKDLAWGGLNFSNNTQLSTGDKIRIQARVSEEQTGIGWGTVMCPITPVEE